MKLKTWFVLSLALNAALFILLACAPDWKAEKTSAMPATPTKPDSLRRMAPRLTWIERLRKEGIGEHLIASVAAADYEERWQKRLLDLQRQFSRGEIESIDLETFIAAREDDLESRMRDCLGEAGFETWDRERVLRSFDTKSLNLSEAEAHALYGSRKSRDRKSRDLQAALLRGEIDEADLERQTEANQNVYERELKELLGESRYASLQCDDGAAGELHRDLARIGSPEAQVEAVLTAQREHQEARARADDERRQNLLTDAEFERQLQTLDAERDRQLLETLGPDSLADLRMQQDDRYRTLQKHAGAWGLSEGDVSYLYDAIRTHDENVRVQQQGAAEAETAGADVDRSAVEKTLRDLARENESTLLNYLGAERFARLKKCGVLAGSP